MFSSLIPKTEKFRSYYLREPHLLARLYTVTILKVKPKSRKVQLYYVREAQALGKRYMLPILKVKQRSKI